MSPKRRWEPSRQCQQINGEFDMNDERDVGEIFRKRLQEVRGRRRMSQQELARKTGLPPSSISHFESGGRRPSFENLKRLAGALSVSTDFLVGSSATDAPGASTGTEKIHQDIEKLSDYDLGIAADFIAMLANKSKLDDR